MRQLLILMLKGYRRYLSGRCGGSCRFEPSCSWYAMESIRLHGSFVGLRLTVGRLLRCRPPYPCGHDPVPRADQIDSAVRGDLVERRDVYPERP